MDNGFKVFVIDDDPFVLDIIRAILDPEYVVEVFNGVAQCQERLAAVKPDMFLLDVRMPGVDGYAFCRQLKDDAHFSSIPVTFVSSNDTIEARLKGYDAGGEDFIVKPFVSEEVLRKVRVAQHIVQSQHQVVQQLEESEMLSSLVMANMDEYAILLRFLRELIVLESEQEIATLTLEMLQRYRLAGVVQIRCSQRSLTLSAQGTDIPLETSIVKHVSGMGRIFEFGNRSVHNFDHLTMMINNLPLDDPDFCGRLRDHLCIAAESAEARLKALELLEANQQSQKVIREAIERISTSTQNARNNYLRDKTACADLLMQLERDFSSVFNRIDLTNSDELTLTRLVSKFNAELLTLLDSGEEAQQAMEDLGLRLAALQL